MESKNLFTQEHFAFRDGEPTTLYVATPRNVSSKIPAVIFFHGLGGHGREPGGLLMMKTLTKLGFLVFSYDYRGLYGLDMEKSGKIMEKLIGAEYFRDIFRDPLDILDHVLKHPNVDTGNIHVVGGSLGGAIVLSTLVNHPHVNKIFALSAPHDYRALFEDGMHEGPLKMRMFFRLWKRKMKNFKEFMSVCREVSPISSISVKPDRPYSSRVFLIQSRDDPLVNFKRQFLKNREKMEIPDGHVLLFEDGGHTCRKYYPNIATWISKWIMQV
ncbi:MAG: alpha/beta hydrolase family protein [Promethearchaeota archaeon]